MFFSISQWFHSIHDFNMREISSLNVLFIQLKRGDFSYACALPSQSKLSDVWSNLKQKSNMLEFCCYPQDLTQNVEKQSACYREWKHHCQLMKKHVTLIFSFLKMKRKPYVCVYPVFHRGDIIKKLLVKAGSSKKR